MRNRNDGMDDIRRLPKSPRHRTTPKTFEDCIEAIDRIEIEILTDLNWYAGYVLRLERIDPDFRSSRDFWRQIQDAKKVIHEIRRGVYDEFGLEEPEDITG